MSKEAKEKQVKEEVTPKKEKKAKTELSEFKLKDEHFTKYKTYLDKKTKVEQSVKADFRNINVGGVKIVAIKGEPLSKVEVGHFDTKAKEFWLEKVK